MRVRRIISISLLICLLVSVFSGCGDGRQTAAPEQLRLIDSMELSYATQFGVDYYEGGYKLITLADGSRFLVVPENAALPDGLDADITPLYQPIENIYLAATSAMCLFDALGRLDSIRLSGTKEDGWYIENAKAAMHNGSIIYAGKYSEPDYELLLSEDTPLAVESMMIGHASEVKAQLERLGIAVLVDQSSNEPHPLGRAEWIKLYGALLSEEEKAEALFRAQTELLDEVSGKEDTEKTVAFFYISSTGSVITRKSGDYVCKMIELAGGHYVFEDLGDHGSKTSSVTLEMETFYETAKDADIILYNATIADEPETMESLLQKNALLADFKAVQTGNVWCTERNMYQETTAFGEIIHSLRQIFTDDGETDELPYFYRIK